MRLSTDGDVIFTTGPAREALKRFVTIGPVRLTLLDTLLIMAWGLMAVVLLLVGWSV